MEVQSVIYAAYASLTINNTMYTGNQKARPQTILSKKQKKSRSKASNAKKARKNNR
jgi:hypothetical protein